jgi:hypothetical protein
LYLQGKDHINEGLRQKFEKSLDKYKKVLILGNGKSRLEKKESLDFIKNWDGEIWGCNKIFQDYSQFKRLDRIGTVHEDLALEALSFKKENKLSYIIHSLKVIEKYEEEIISFKEKRGWSSGSEMLLQALYENYDEIFLCGFDFGGPDVYQPKDVEGSNFKNQFISIKKEFRFHNVFFVGKTPEFIAELEAKKEK